nr:hypothetical protein [Tanacetum cinerariifolium]
SPTSYLGPKAISNLFRGGKVTSGLSSLRLAEGSCDGGGLRGGAGANMSEGGDSIGGSSRKGICGGGEDQGDNSNAGGEDIARSLTTS